MSLPSADFFIHPTAIVDDGCQLGAGTKVWHFCHLSSNVFLGERCNLGQNVFIADGVRLGANVKAQNNVSIYAGVICEDDVFLGPSMVFTNVRNPRSGVNRRGEYAQTLVKKGATIGANATIVCGVTIGRYAFIGAGAVVTKNVPDFALMTGNPARQRGWMSAYGEKLTFDENGEARCPATGQRYLLRDGIVTLVE